MKSIEERLIGSDPSPSGPYAPADYSTMIDRVVATPLGKPAAGLRAFKLRMAGSVAAASLLTALGIAAIDTVGSSLPVLGFAAASTHPALGKYAAAATPTRMVMIPAMNYEFNGAGGFSSQAGTATVYTMQAPSDGVATLVHAAGVLKVDIGTAVSHDHGQTLTSSGPKYSGTLSKNSGYAWWQISDNSSPAASQGSPAPVASLEALAFSLAQQMGSLDLGIATVVPVPAPPGGPTTVTVPIMVAGEPTDLGYDFMFASDGTLLSATGEDFSVRSSASYPTVSPAAGVGEITPQLGLASISVGWVAAGSGSGASGSAPPGDQVPSPGNGHEVTTTVPSTSVGSAPVTSGSPPTTVANPTTRTPPAGTSTSPTTVTTVTPTVVDLTGVSTKYGFFTMSDSTSKLLPVYVYTGTIVDASPSQATFQVVAVDASYLDLTSVQNISN